MCRYDDGCRLMLPDGTCAAERANDGPMSRDEIARLMGCTKQNIDYIERTALRKIRPLLLRMRP